MRILILGGDGMLGHQLRRSLGTAHDVRATVRLPVAAYRDLDVPHRGLIGEVDALDWPRVERAVQDSAPDVIINCIGLVKQRPDAASPVLAIQLNALLPHQLGALSERIGARLIHFSTDCVFSGRTGGYRETDVPDPVDLYGRSKLLGEVGTRLALTLRTSIIGLELTRKTGLIEWFLAQRGTIRGYRRAIYSGLTTLEMSRLVGQIVERHAGLNGVWHVASSPLSKYDLLVLFRRLLGRTDVDIVPDDELVCDRSLDAGALHAATGYHAPDWDAMLHELADEVQQRKRDGTA